MSQNSTTGLKRDWNIARAASFMVLVVISAGVLTESGCYRRVVAARGMGADQYEVSEPYQENSKVDDWMFGERPARNNTRLKNMGSVGE